MRAETDRIEALQRISVESRALKELAAHPEIARFFAAEEAKTMSVLLDDVVTPQTVTACLAYMKAMHRLASHIGHVIKTGADAEQRLRRTLETRNG